MDAHPPASGGHPEDNVLADATDWFAKSDYENALKGYRAVLAIANVNQDDARIAATWRMIGVCLGRKNDAARLRLEFEQKALDLSARIGDIDEKAEALLGLTGALCPAGAAGGRGAGGTTGDCVESGVGRASAGPPHCRLTSPRLGEKGDQEAKAAMLRGGHPDQRSGQLSGRSGRRAQ